MRRSGLRREEIPEFKQAVEDGITIEEAAKLFELEKSAAKRWFNEFKVKTKPTPKMTPKEE